MASLRSLAAGLSALGLSLALASCGSSPGAGPSAGVGYETVIAAVVLAESEAGGRAFELEIEGDTAQVHVAAAGRDVEVDVDLAGPTVTDRRDDGDLDGDDRATMDAAPTTLADAVRVAAATHDGDGSVDEVSLENGDGAAWKVAFTDASDVAVSVTDGTIVRSAG